VIDVRRVVSQNCHRGRKPGACCAVAALVRAAFRAAEFIEQPENRAEAAHILAQPDRIGVGAEIIQRTLDGRLKISPDGTVREAAAICCLGGRMQPDLIPCRPRTRR
jgi:hypothetical protein